MHRLFLKFTICIKLLTFYIMKSMSFVDAVKSVVVENYANSMAVHAVLSIGIIACSV